MIHSHSDFCFLFVLLLSDTHAGLRIGAPWHERLQLSPYSRCLRPLSSSAVDYLALQKCNTAGLSVCWYELKRRELANVPGYLVCTGQDSSVCLRGRASRGFDN